jgi:hypothetical protein
VRHSAASKEGSIEAEDIVGIVTRQLLVQNGKFRRHSLCCGESICISKIVVIKCNCDI